MQPADGVPSWPHIETAAANVSGLRAKYTKVLAAFAQAQPPEVFQDFLLCCEGVAALSDFGPR